MKAYPKEMTPALREVLGTMIMTTCPIAHGMRAAGADIPTKTEAEHAHVLHWMIGLALEHGDNWRAVAGAELQIILEKARAAKAAA